MRIKFLDDLDNFLASQKESEEKVFYILPIILFAFISYYMIYPITDEMMKKSQKHFNTTKNKIKNLKKDNKKKKTLIITYKKVIQKIDKELVILEKNKKDVENLVKSLKFLRFDLPKWAKFYNKIPIMADDVNLEIVKIDNVLYPKEDDKLVVKKMNITINVRGDFLNFIRFIHKFEDKKEFIKIKQLDIQKNEFIVSLDIYGAEL